MTEILLAVAVKDPSLVILKRINRVYSTTYDINICPSSTVHHTICILHTKSLYLGKNKADCYASFARPNCIMHCMYLFPLSASPESTFLMILISLSARKECSNKRRYNNTYQNDLFYFNQYTSHVFTANVI